AAIYEVDAKQQEESRHRQENTDAQNSANIAKQQSANARAQELQDRELVRGQQKALQQARDAERSRSARTPKYTTVLHPLLVGRSASGCRGTSEGFVWILWKGGQDDCPDS